MEKDIYEDKVTRKKKVGLVNAATGDIVPEGSIHTNEIQLQITGEGSVELSLMYSPKSDKVESVLITLCQEGIGLS